MRWVLQLLIALDFIHEECRILHRDLKPQNIFLGSDDIVKLGDLGIAKTLDKSLDMARTVCMFVLAHTTRLLQQISRF